MRSSVTGWLLCVLAACCGTASAQSFVYDGAGRLVSVRYTSTNAITYEYDLNGSLSNVVLTGSMGMADTDTDGMDDAWELVYFNTLTNPPAGDSNKDTKSNLQHFQDGTDPTDPDSDGDGALNTDETFADMDPLDSNSCFRLTAIRCTDSRSVTFVCTNSRVYSLQYTTNLLDGGWGAVAGATNVPGAGSSMSLTDTVNCVKRLYRVVVSLPP